MLWAKSVLVDTFFILFREAWCWATSTSLEHCVADNEAADEDNIIADDLNEAVIDIDSDNKEDYLMGTFYKSQIQTQPQS